MLRYLPILLLLVGCSTSHIRPVKAMQIPDPSLIREKPFVGMTHAGESLELSFPLPGSLSEFVLDSGDFVKEGQTLARIEETVLKAPFDGIITAKFAQNFDFVEKGQPIMSLLDQAHIEMVVDIPEHMVAYVPNVREILVRFDAFPERRFQAKVKEIAQEASAATKAIPVILLIDQPEDLALTAGLSGEAKFIGEIEPEKSEAFIILPIQAVFNNSQESYVWIINPATQTAHKRIIEISSVENTGVHVTKGLEPGEWVATAGLQYLNEGQKIRLLEAQFQ